MERKQTVATLSYARRR